MKHLFNKVSAFIVMLMCISATAQAEIVVHDVCAPTLSSRGFAIMCWEDSETGKYYKDVLRANAFSLVDYYNLILYLNLPKNPATNTAGFNLSDESEHWKYSAKYEGLDGTEMPTKYIEYVVRGDKVSNARIVWDTDNSGSGYKYNVKIYVNNNQVYIESGEVNGFYIANISNVKPNDVIKFEVKPLFQSMEGSYSANFHARLQYTYECDHEYSVGSHKCSKCGYISAHSDVIHHEVCDPTLSTRGFKHECWELDGKFYSNAACTNELQGKELAQTVVYAKLPASPVTSTSEFTRSEHENDWSVDFNWAAVTTFQNAKTNKYTTTRYAEFTATREEVSNARLVWMRSHGDVVNGKYTVKIYVNGTEKFSVDQNDNKNVEGVFVQPLPGLKSGDVVKFEVTPNDKATYNYDDPDPTFKASLEYNTNVVCIHEYPTGSAICSKCGEIKDHEHNYVDGLCTLCGAIESGAMIGYVGTDADRKNVKWELNKATHVLTFTGTGAMEAFNLEHNAWRNEHKTTVTKVVIGEGITTIGAGANNNGYFFEMSGLTEVSLPSTLKTIGSTGFRDCINLTSITLPEGLETIETSGIRNCKKLTTITLPSTLTTIGTYAFADCHGLTDVYMTGSQEITTSLSAFDYISSLSNITLHVNGDLYDWAKRTSPWKYFNIPRPYNIKYTDAEGESHEVKFDIEASDNTFAITDGAYENLAIYEDIPMQQLTYTRNFSTANTWQALYVPFEMQHSDWSDKFDVAAITNFHEYTDENGKTEKVELEVRYVKNGKLLANIPYLIRAKAAGEQTIVLNDVTLKSTEVKSIGCSSTERRYTFTGTYDAISQLQTKGYIFVSGGRLCKANNDTDVLKPMRWYLTIEDYFSVTGNAAPALAKPMTIHVIGEDDATGIEEVTVISSPVGTAASGIYSLTGAKLAKPQQGINIINGNKILVK